MNSVGYLAVDIYIELASIFHILVALTYILSGVIAKVPEVT